jgi:hypothetical protein
MLVGVGQVVAKVKATGTLDQKRPTSTIPIQKALMATKLTKINASKNQSKSTATSMKTYVTELMDSIRTTRPTEILVRPKKPNAQALGL